MATFTWLGGSGLFTSDNWSINGTATALFPGFGDVFIADGSTSYTITVTDQRIVQDFILDDPNAELRLGNGGATAGVTAGDGSTINAGTIAAGAAVSFLSGGTVANSGTILSAGQGAFELSISAQNIFINNGLISIDGDSDTIFSPFRLNNAGTIAVTDFGTLTLVGSFTNQGLMTLSDSGSLDLAPNGVLVNGSIQFLDGTASKLTVRTPGLATVPTTIVNFQPGNTIDLPNVVFSDTETAVIANNTIVVSDISGGLLRIPVSGIVAGSTFTVADDGHGHAQLTTLACFAAGTRIQTPRGTVAVEDLSAGDLVDTQFAGVVPVAWIGHRTVDCRRHPNPEKVWPIRVRAGAFADHVPRRDLFLSPDHSVYMEDVLIPIQHLVNGTTITQVRRDVVAYFHVELPRHDVLLAEGLAAESYLDTGDRPKFENGGGAITLYPEFTARIWEAMGCAPLVVIGREVNVLREKIAERARHAGSVASTRAKSF